MPTGNEGEDKRSRMPDQKPAAPQAPVAKRRPDEPVRDPLGLFSGSAVASEGRWKELHQTLRRS